MENVATEEFISRTEALKDFESCNAENPHWTPQRVKTLLLRQRTADAMRVVHGHWIEYQIPHIICCSVCDWGTGPEEKTNYCPMCFAKMDGGDEQ